MNGRIINLIAMVSAFLLLSCESPVSEKPETTSSSSEMSSSVNEVSSSSVIVSSSSVELSSSSFTIPDTIYGVDAHYPLSIVESCDRWGMTELDSTKKTAASWMYVPDLNYEGQVFCDSTDSHIWKCSYHGLYGNSVKMSIMSEKTLEISISFNSKDIFPVNFSDYISNGLTITDSTVEATLIRGDSTYQVVLGRHSMKFLVEVQGIVKSIDLNEGSERSWHSQIGNISEYGYTIPGINLDGEPIQGRFVHFISDSTGKETTVQSWSDYGRTTYLSIDDTLRYVYWSGYAGIATLCGSWDGDQIRLH